MSDISSNARAAREMLARGLSQLQANPGAPASYLEAAEPIATAMGALHRIERGGAAELATASHEALASIRSALSMLQASAAHDPRMMQIMETVAESLGTVFGLTKLAQQPAQAQPPAPYQPPPQPQAPQPAAAPYQPPPQPQAPQPAAAPYQPPPQAGYQPYAPQQAPYQPPQPAPAPYQPPQQAPYQPGSAQGAPYQPPAPQHAPYQPQPAPAPYQPPAPQQPLYQPPVQAAPAAYQPPVPAAPAAYHAPQPAQPPWQPPPAAQPAPFHPPGTSPQPAPGKQGWAELDPFAAPAQPPAAAPAPSKAALPEDYRSGDQLPLVEAELGAHSPSNLFKGLAGNDIVDHGGLFVATYQIPKVGQSLRVRVSMPGGYEFEAVGVVRWTRESRESMTSDISPPGFGLQFTHISADARQLVYRYARNREPLFHDDL